MLYAYKILTGKEKIKKIDFINGIDPTRYVVTNTGYVIDDKRGVLKTAKKCKWYTCHVECCISMYCRQ